MANSKRHRREKVTYCGRKNLAGLNIRRIRESLNPKCSQEGLCKKLQLEGLNVEKQTVQSIESGNQGLSDIELYVFAKVLGVDINQLMNRTEYGNVEHVDQYTTEYSESSDGYGTRSVAEK